MVMMTTIFQSSTKYGSLGFFGCPKSDDQRLDSQEIKQVQGEIKFKVGRYGNMGSQIFKGEM